MEENRHQVHGLITHLKGDYSVLTLICVNVYEIMGEFLINVWKTC